jgi:hypothetical protein
MRIVSLAIVLVACGSDGPNEGDFPTCAAKEVHAVGTVGPTLYVFVGFVTSYAFINAIGGAKGTLDVTMDFADRRLHVEWPTLVANGSSIAARGSLDTGTTATDFAFGNCDQDSFGGRLEVDADGEGGRFVLENLKSKPYCGGQPVTGELLGCFRK